MSNPEKLLYSCTMCSQALYSLPRLYIPSSDLTADGRVEISDQQHHYLRHVMRRQMGDALRVFNGRDGEWRGVIEQIDKKTALLRLVEKTREQTSGGKIIILCSTLKKEAFDLTIEKCSELGAAAFQPLICDRTVAPKINMTRATAIAVEAAEQCERLDVISIHEPIVLKDCLENRKDHKNIFCALERCDADKASDFAFVHDQPIEFLVGPEGGFSDREREWILTHPRIRLLNLGPQILRAETAVIAGLSILNHQLLK